MCSDADSVRFVSSLQRPSQLSLHKFTPKTGAKYCDEYVCLSVCTLAYLRNGTSLIYFVHVDYDSVTICCVLPVLSMTSCLPYDASKRRQDSVTSETTALIATELCLTIKTKYSWWIGLWRRSRPSTNVLLI